MDCLTANITGVVGVFRPSVLYVNNNIYNRNSCLLGPLLRVMERRRCNDHRHALFARVGVTRLNGSTNVVNTTLLKRGWRCGGGG